jgi:hypothetical protein
MSPAHRDHIESENGPVLSWCLRDAGVSGNGEVPATSTYCALDHVLAGNAPGFVGPYTPSAPAYRDFQDRPSPHGLPLRGVLSLGAARHLANIFVPVSLPSAKRQLLQEDQTDRRASRKPSIWSQDDRAARLAAIPAGESPANRGFQSLL